MARRAIESLVDCFVEAIDPTQQSINDFICAHPYAVDGGIDMATLKLQRSFDKLGLDGMNLLHD